MDGQIYIEHFEMLGELTTQDAKHTHTLTKTFFQAINFFKDHDNYFAGPVLWSAPAIFLVLKCGEKCVEELHSPPPSATYKPFTATSLPVDGVQMVQ